MLGARNPRTTRLYEGSGGPAQAIAEAAAGDEILVLPGRYLSTALGIEKSLVIKSSVPGSRAIFDANGGNFACIYAGGNGSRITLEDIGLTGNLIEWGNFAGVWTTGGAYVLTLRRCEVWGCCNGILVGDHRDADIILEGNYFHDNGDYNGRTHNVYVSGARSLTAQGNWVRNTRNRVPGSPDNWRISWGHLIKSRARLTTLMANRLTMENGEANRCVDLPNGGEVTLRGNMLEYRTTQNQSAGQFISYGVEEAVNPMKHTVHKLVMERNTFVNRGGPFADVIWVRTDAGGIPAPSLYRVRDNVFAGPHMPSVKGDAAYAISTADNVVVALTDFMDVDNYDWRLKTRRLGAMSEPGLRYVHPQSTAERADSERGAVPAAAPAKALAAWAPQRDAGGNITNFAALPARTWTMIPGSAMTPAIQPILDAGGYTLYRYGSNKLSAVMDNFSGMAWDFSTGRGWAHGGGHEGGSDNGVYQLDLNKMKWSITAYPSKPGTDLTPQQTALFGEGTRASGAAGTAPAHVYPLAQSSTGFAIKDWLSYSTVAWYAVTGPERDVRPTDIVFPNGDTWSQARKHPIERPFPTAGGENDILWDGRPAPRHTYGGFLYSPKIAQLVLVTRQYWRCKTDGTGWVKHQDGGRANPTVPSGENLWAHVDEKTGKIWWGGCGSGCWGSNYYFYRKGLIFEPATMTDAPSPDLTSGPVHMTNAGDGTFLSFKIERKIGGWSNALYGWTFDLDTQARQFLYMTGSQYGGSKGEGNSTCYIPHLRQLWIFDAHVAALPAWSLDMSNPQPGGPNGALTVQAKVETLANANKLPPAPSGLVYNRLSFWAEKKLIVYCPDAAQDTWVCRIP